MAKTPKTSQRHEIHFGKESIPLLMEFRAVKRLSINVHPDRRVTVTAPDTKSVDDILARIQRRAGWIVKQRAYFDQFHPLPPAKRYVSGEAFCYLGRQYRLKVAKGTCEEVQLIGRYIWVQLQDPSAPNVERLLQNWYRDHATPVFDKRLKACLDSARTLGIAAPKITVRALKKRWGSCTRSGRVVLNVELVKAPLHCNDYVIMHELCHLRSHDHSPKFYALLSRFMPDWNFRKMRLESVVL